MTLITRIVPASLLVVFLVGCGGEPSASVSGKVTYKGSPVTAGSISFLLKGKGITQDAKLDATGAFTMAESLPIGTYQVVYVPPTPEPQDPTKPRKVETAPVAVPTKYRDEKTSGIAVEILNGKNEIPIEFKN